MYVVLLYEKYYEDMKEPIYKLGMSNLRLNTKRIVEKVVYYETCNDIGSIEELMRNKYIHRLDIGNNYYYGDTFRHTSGHYGDPNKKLKCLPRIKL
jgi:hypothetical protein